MRIFSKGNLLTKIGHLATFHTSHPNYTNLLTRFTSKEFINSYENALLRRQSKLAETTSQDGLWEYQVRRLRVIAQKAYTLPFYRRIFQKYGVKPEDLCLPEDLQKLPIVEKKDFRSCAPEEYMDLELGKVRGHWAQTSGSTGEPFRILQDHKNCARSRAFTLRMFEWFSISPYSRRVDFVSPRGRSSVSEWLNQQEHVYLPVTDFHTKIEGYARFIENFQPTIIESNPSYLIYFARFLRESKRKICVPYLVSSGAELYEEERELIENVFSGEVINRYGLTDVTTIGAECLVHNGFHANSLCCIVEIVDKNGKHVDDTEGDIIVTSLINEITPLIRYHTGDRGQWLHGNCTCGKKYSRFTVSGRRDDVLILEDGRMLHTHSFRKILYEHFDFIRQFQIVQISKYHIDIRIVPMAPLPKDERANIIVDFRNLVGPKFVITLSEHQYIPWAPNGKYKALVTL